MSTMIPTAGAGADIAERRFPPVAEVSTGALVLIVIGGVYMAAYSPRRPPLTVPIILASLSAVLLLTALIMLTRARELAWDKFFLVGRWTLLSYVIAAGLIEFAFVKDHLSGGPLALITAMLFLFALIVPLIISFTVARYQSDRPATN